MSSEKPDVPAWRWLAVNFVMNVVLWVVGMSYYLKGDGQHFTNAATMVGCCIVCAVGWLMMLHKRGQRGFTGRTLALLLLVVNIGFAVVLAWDLPNLHDVGPPR